jgi:site-specific DNA-methyltransferase (cytosine-N4-specific)
MTSSIPNQLSLFAVHKAYSESEGPITAPELYRNVSDQLGITDAQLNEKAAVGRSQAKHSPIKRKIRWHQQTLKKLGIIKPVPGQRGVWELVEKIADDLDAALPEVQLVAYSTELGAAIWGDCKSAFSKIDEPIHLCVTSPPYPLRVKRSYGNRREQAWIDFICESLEPIVNNLVAGGSVVLNVTNDIHQPKSPARSLYLERMVISLHDRLGLQLMDRWIWSNPGKPPAPTYWACVNKKQLCTGYEPVYWFTNDPDNVRSDNQRVLVEHSDNHKKLMAGGGEARTTSYGDGAYQIKPGDFGTVTAGKIPKNVITRGAACSDTRLIRRLAEDGGLPAHPAMFPTALPEFAIKFLTQPGELVVDPFAGANKTGMACERLGRRWLSTERVLQYIKLQAEFFRDQTGFQSMIPKAV